MKHLLFAIALIFFATQANADYMCGSSPCYSEYSCNEKTGYCGDCSDEGYGHNAEGKCVRCQDPNCDNGDTCEEDYTYCDYCKDGYESINGKCEEIVDSSNCSENCDTCVSSGKCIYCQNGYYVENGNCKKNPEGCLWYNVNEGKCRSCNSGYYVENGNCKKNPEGCANYTEGKGCDSCNAGFSLVYTNGLGVCKEGCCIYYKDGKCTYCSSGCGAFEMNGVCMQYGEDSNRNIPHCLRTHALNNQPTVCMECESGYMVFEGGCIANSEGCPNGYRIIASLYNKPNAKSCIDNNCSYEVNNICLSCRTSSGKYAKDGKCVDDCGENWSAYSSNGHSHCTPKHCKATGSRACNECDEGYFSQDGACVAECKKGYIAGTNSNGYPSCFPADLGCGYGEKQVGDKCVARKDGEGCGEGFSLKDNLCVSESKDCGDGEMIKDNVCIKATDGCGDGYDYNENYNECFRKRYTLPEADELTSNDNENMIEWIFE